MSRFLLGFVLAATPLLGLAQNPSSALAPFLPRPADYTLMFWAEGFPAHLPSAPWRRVIRTGHYAAALETDSLRISHLGPADAGGGYAAAGQETKAVWENLPGADLSLSIALNGQTYSCLSGSPWTQYAGPRLIESGRFLQRADVTGLAFRAADGSVLNVEARLETVAWPDRIGLIFAARPGLQPIPPGEACFGHQGGGFGLDGTNHMELPHRPELDPEVFTLALWVYVPVDCQASPKTFPWLVCKNHHEQADGNYGIVLINGKPQARLNIGGGRENQFEATSSRPLTVEAWNHLAISYDGQDLRLYVNEQLSGQTPIGRKRVPGKAGLAFGRRQDNSGDGYHFRGVIDEVRLYNQALTPAQWKNGDAPAVEQLDFRADGIAANHQPRAQWPDGKIEIALNGMKRATVMPQNGNEWSEAGVFLDPVRIAADESPDRVTLAAADLASGSACPVSYDPRRGWHRIDLNATTPSGAGNDAMERIKLTLANDSADEQTARILFDKTVFRQRIGAAITGISAVLRDSDGQPTGIPVQLSKNWHNRPEGGVYAGQWFHGVSLIHLPAKAKVELELCLTYGHWGGVAAASHAQLCLIGWGSNQLWDQSAMGSWGESICYEPDQVQADCGILDVRPVMVASRSNNQPWGWTNNVGGGDFFRAFSKDGERLFPAGVRTVYQSQGPCLTTVTYSGQTGHALRHQATVSLGRTDDLVRGIYHLRLDVDQPLPVSRFVVFQIGADTYSYTGERKMALGHAGGLIREWNTQWGGDTYRTEPVECTGQTPWISLHDAVSRAESNQDGAWANRGIVIREWRARLGGKSASPWMAERGIGSRGALSSTADLVLPPGVNQLEPGDFIEATIEHLIIPQFAKDYYGPDEELRAALQTKENTWQMVHREATGNDRQVQVSLGKLQGRYPAIAIATEQGKAEFTVQGGLGYVPMTFSGLASPAKALLQLDGSAVDQHIHGNDYWQTNYDAETGTWSMTFNLALSPGKPHQIQFSSVP
jgi:hypothetical protein